MAPVHPGPLATAIPLLSEVAVPPAFGRGRRVQVEIAPLLELICRRTEFGFAGDVGRRSPTCRLRKKT